MNSTSRARLRVGACLSLTGRFGRFGVQAAKGLEAWRSLDGAIELVIEDDLSEPRMVETALGRVARRCDVLLGPYSTHLMRTAGRIAAEADWLLWNHGGSGDDVESAHPGHVISVLTPTSRYAEPFLKHLTSAQTRALLLIAHGKGRFGRQVAEGAEVAARRLGIQTAHIGPDDSLPTVDSPWDLFSAGVFEDDVEIVKRAHALPVPPRMICAVAAGVRDFSDAVDDAEGTLGIAQWFAGERRTPGLGPAEADFLAAYTALTGTVPDYPAVQAAGAGILAAHCARQAPTTARDDLWPAAAALDTHTMFGAFRINPADGVQLKHETVLVRWTAEGLTRV
jgi:ABC-type branched-subunit amino acid transport system substrate-binding protein